MRKLDFVEIHKIMDDMDAVFAPIVNTFLVTNENLGVAWCEELNANVSDPKFKIPMKCGLPEYSTARDALGFLIAKRNHDIFKPILGHRAFARACKNKQVMNDYAHKNVDMVMDHFTYVDLIEMLGHVAAELGTKEAHEPVVNLRKWINDIVNSPVQVAPKAETLRVPFEAAMQAKIDEKAQDSDSDNTATIVNTFSTETVPGRKYINTTLQAHINRVSQPRGGKYAIDIISENGESQILYSYSMAAYEYYQGMVGQAATVIRNNLNGGTKYNLANDMVANKLERVVEAGWSKWVATSTGGNIRFNNAEGYRQIAYKSKGQWKIMEVVAELPYYPIDDTFATVAQATEAAEGATSDDDRLTMENLFF